MNIDVVSASAGTGKTYRLTGDLTAALLDGSARPEGVVAITFTVKAAGELESRIRARLLEAGRPDLAARRPRRLHRHHPRGLPGAPR